MQLTDLMRGAPPWLDRAMRRSFIQALEEAYGTECRLPPSVAFDDAAGLPPVLERHARQPRTALYLFGPWAPPWRSTVGPRARLLPSRGGTLAVEVITDGEPGTAKFRWDYAPIEWPESP